MTTFAHMLVIAGGVVLGLLGWEILGLLFGWAGKLVGWLIANSMKQMIAAREARVATEVAAAARRRPPLVTETGREINDASIDHES